MNNESVEQVNVYYIYDMISMLKLREADLDEIEESKVSLEKTSAPTIMIDNIMYLVSTESGAPAQSSKTVADTLKPDADDTTVSNEDVIGNFLSQLNDTQRAALIAKLLGNNEPPIVEMVVVEPPSGSE